MTEQITTPAPAEDAKATRDKALREAYGKATADLRGKHQTEFNSLYQARAKELGQEWTPKKSAEEKAAEDLAAILAKHPSLAAKIAAQVAGPA